MDSCLDETVLLFGEVRGRTGPNTLHTGQVCSGLSGPNNTNKSSF